MERTRRKIGWVLVVVAVQAALWAAGVGWSLSGGGGSFCAVQRELWSRCGTVVLCDYYMPWKAAHEGYAAGDAEIAMPACRIPMTNADRTYPALALLPHRLLPYSFGAAVGYSCVGLLVYLLALLVVAEGDKRMLLLAFSAPLISALERGNPIWFAAAACAVFFAWWDREDELVFGCFRLKRKYVAALCLAVASVLKISPVLLSVLLLRRRDWKTLALFVGAGAFLFLLPFVWFGGLEGILQWMANAGENGRLMSPKAAFGLYPFVRLYRIALGQDWQHGDFVWRVATQVIGLALVLLGGLSRDRVRAMLLVTIGFIFAAGNMMYYGVLYLLPLFALRCRYCSRLEFLLWFALLCPLQIPLGPTIANRIAASTAVLALAMLDVWKVCSIRGRAILARKGPLRFA